MSLTVLAWAVTTIGGDPMMDDTRAPSRGPMIYNARSRARRKRQLNQVASMLHCPGEGTYQHPHNDSRYYRCEHNRMTMDVMKPYLTTAYDCPEGHYFPKGSDRCLHRREDEARQKEKCAPNAVYLRLAADRTQCLIVAKFHDFFNVKLWYCDDSDMQKDMQFELGELHGEGLREIYSPKYPDRCVEAEHTTDVDRVGRNIQLNLCGSKTHGEPHAHQKFIVSNTTRTHSVFHEPVVSEGGTSRMKHHATGIRIALHQDTSFCAATVAYPGSNVFAWECNGDPQGEVQTNFEVVECHEGDGLTSASDSILQNAGAESTGAIAANDRSVGEELAWLSEIVKKMPARVRDRLVLHRGFHSADESIFPRPIENTAPAYIQAWSSGLTYAECDIIRLADGTPVLNHDTNFERFAAAQSRASTVLHEMNYPDVLKMPLKNGVTAPTLTEILHYAKALDGRLVVELKSDRPQEAEALLAIFTTSDSRNLTSDNRDTESDAAGDNRNPTSDNAGNASNDRDTTSDNRNQTSDTEDLLRYVAVVMSFDLQLLKRFVQLYNEANLSVDVRPRFLLCTVKEKRDDPMYQVITPWTFPLLPTLLTEAGLDGVYLEWSPKLIGPAKDDFKRLCSEFPGNVGVWNRPGDPFDRLGVVETLIELGAAFINTDLPYNFTLSS